ncbi:MAG: glycoside hydrolase family 95 protein [Eubacteriales bacterium]
MTKNKLWYQQPATTFIEALPIGNGNFGGMVYGGVLEEKISLNCDTLWSGNHTRKEKSIPKEHLDHVRTLVQGEKYKEAEAFVTENMLGFYNESYVPMGNLVIQHNIEDAYTEYTRRLNLENAVHTTKFSCQNTEYTREVFSSYPDDVIAFRYQAQGEKKLELSIGFQSELQPVATIKENQLVVRGVTPSHVIPNYKEDPNPVIFDDMNPGIPFTTIINIEETDGIIKEVDGTLQLVNGSHCVIYVSTANGFEKYNKEVNRNQEAIDQLCFSKIEKVTEQSFEEVLRRHIADYQELYRRVTFSLSGDGRDDIPTDQRLEALQKGEEDQELYTLYYQYGRYLMIASSRQGSQPTTLQGIWNEELRPAWSSNYTTNINTEMNYWMVNSGNLSECEEPLIEMLDELRVQGQEVAREQFHCRGFVANHNIDLWRQTAPVGGLPKFAYWPLGGVWLSTHAYMHYEYTQDIEYLKTKAYPIIKESSLFCLDWLIEDGKGGVMTCPSTTPENEFYDTEGNICSISQSSAADIGMITHMLESFIAAATTLGEDKEMIAEVKDKLNRMPSYQIGNDGCIQEWSVQFEEVEKGHRHFSPLYGLYPGNSMNQLKNPELIDASRKLIEKRLENGGGHTGWSCAWLISLFARLQDQEQAYHYLEHLLMNSTYPNLFDLHPPLGENFEGEKEVFQIDGNFGGTAAIVEMLVQNQNGELIFLPALPKQWKKGELSGIIVRGGHKIMVQWEEGKLVKASLRAKNDACIKVNEKREIVIRCDEKMIPYQRDERNNYTFAVEKGKVYEITA